LIRIGALAALAALLACRSEPVASVAGAPEPAASAAAAPPFDAARFDPAARAFVEAALAYAETCNLETDEPGNWFDYITYDVCSTDTKDTGPVIAAGKTFQDVAAPMANPPVPAKALADQVRIFREWAEGVEKIQVSRGTMLLYQGLALAYNAYKPEAKVPTEPKRALDQFFVEYPQRGVAYIWEQKGCYDAQTLQYNGCEPGRPTVRLDRYAIHRQRGTPLAWRSSPQGPFLAD
jgi:hypothetical protein